VALLKYFPWFINKDEKYMLYGKKLFAEEICAELIFFGIYFCGFL